MVHVKGFSIIELMFVLIVLSLLSVIALPAYQGYVAKGDIVRCANLVLSTRMSADSLIQVNNGSAESITTNGLGIGSGEDCDSVSISSATANGGITIVGSIDSSVGNQQIRLARGENGVWACTSSDDKYAPINCP
ncbi:MAG: pilin [Cellvibrionaceae bacterium]